MQDKPASENSEKWLFCTQFSICSVCGPIIGQAEYLGMMFYFLDIKTYT